jgi:AraC family transcriptional regulator, regulatory protein of adaptative response / DNA-3-methyladenine glycosylase II
MLEPETCYRAIQARDPRFDGCFFVGVTSTGIYCRPVCRVKMPKRENCVFFSNPAAAEASGYRPCLRCRPELAPGNAGVYASHRLAQSAAILMEEETFNEAGIEGIASRLGVTARHLRRVFQEEFGVPPIAFAQTQRLLMAKRLLTDTSLSVTDIAFTAGFNSLRRFDALFKERYRLSPREMRKSSGPDPQSDVLSFDLSYRPPYDWGALIEFLSARSIYGVETVDKLSYRRIVRIPLNGQAHEGWVEITPDQRRHVMKVKLSSTLGKVIPGVLSRVKHLMDLSCNPEQIRADLGQLAIRPGLRVPGAFDGFEIAVRAVLGQQVSVAAARTLAGRFAAAFGTRVNSPFDTLSTAFPLPDQVANQEIAKITVLGVLPTRARTILELANALNQGVIILTPGVDVTATIEKLQSIAGIGQWTAQYIAMRALAWPDAFPHTDLGVMKALGERNPKLVLQAGEAWRPWRAYAVMHLWTGENSNGSVR